MKRRGRETLPTRVRGEGLPLIPAGLTVAVAIAWAATGGGYESQPVLGGGYDPDSWYLGALVLVGLWCATALGLMRVRLSRWAAIACGALAAYTVWSFLSVLWAHDQSAALLGSDRTLVYLAAFTTFAILPWSRWSLRIALVGLVAGLGALAVIVAVRLAVLANPSSLYLDARLVYPLGYYNADAAMFMMTALVAVALACRRGGAPVPRVAGLVVAAVCLQLALLSQSRGWLFTAPVVLLLALLIVPGRLRLLAFALGPVAATAVAAPALLRVYSGATVGAVALAEPRLGQILHRQGAHAARVMLLADVALAIAAALAVVVDRRMVPNAGAARRANRISAAIAVAAVLAAVAAGLAAVHGHPVERIERAWNSFANTSTGAGTGTSGSSRFSALGSQRVDFWRVALHEWSAHPLIGIGQDNFAAGYLRLRHTDQEPRWVHSLELRLLVHTGLVGALLFTLFVVAVAIAALRGPSVRRSHGQRVAAAIGLLPAIVWLVHGSIDWFWEFPALSVPALAFAGAATALAPSQPAVIAAARARPRAPAVSRARALAKRGVVAVLGAGALAALAIPFAAAHQVQRATQTWPDRSALAYAQLRSASSLLPFDAQIDVIGAAIALDLGEAGAAHHWFGEVERKDSEEWLAPFMLGLLEGERGRAGRMQARTQLQRARRLDPREPLIGQALARLPTAHPLTTAEAQTDLSLRTSARFGR